MVFIDVEYKHELHVDLQMNTRDSKPDDTIGIGFTFFRFNYEYLLPVRSQYKINKTMYDCMISYEIIIRYFNCLMCSINNWRQLRGVNR